jgi:hypothetical protein
MRTILRFDSRSCAIYDLKSFLAILSFLGLISLDPTVTAKLKNAQCSFCVWVLAQGRSSVSTDEDQEILLISSEAVKFCPQCF